MTISSVISSSGTSKSSNDESLCILIVGLGLIGGSFAVSIRNGVQTHKVLGFDLNSESIEEAISLGIIDQGVDSLEAGVEQADVIMLSVPMLAMDKVLESLKTFDLTNKVVTDVGSCKISLVRAAEKIFGSVPTNLVPGHPIAGSEKSGVAAAKEGLFKGP